MMSPSPEWYEPRDVIECHHDGRMTYFTSDAGTRYLICCDCYEALPDPEEEDDG